MLFVEREKTGEVLEWFDTGAGGGGFGYLKSRIAPHTGDISDLRTILFTIEVIANLLLVVRELGAP